MDSYNVGGAEPHTRSLLRIVTGFVFMEHGLQKLFGMFGGLPAGVDASPLSQVWVAGVLETFGGALIVLGLFTRIVAFVLCGLMAVAYFTAHAPQGFWPMLNGGELAVLYCFVYLYFAAAGPGPWSLDEMMQGRRKRPRPAGARDPVY